MVITFPQCLVARPRFTEKDGEPRELMPNEARLRNLTYSSALYVDIHKTTRKTTATGADLCVDEEELKEVPSFRLCA